MSIFRTTPPAEFEVSLEGGLDLRAAFVRPEHRPQFEKGYQLLSAHSRRMHFFAENGPISPAQAEFLTTPDGRNHIAYAAEEVIGDVREPAGVARCVKLDADSKIAEVKITIVDHYQDKGVGMLLHALLHRHASAVDIRQFIYDLHVENTRYSEHLTALGAKLVSTEGDILRLILPVFSSVKSIRQTTPAAERFKAMLERVLDL